MLYRKYKGFLKLLLHYMARLLNRMTHIFKCLYYFLNDFIEIKQLYYLYTSRVLSLITFEKVLLIFVYSNFTISVYKLDIINSKKRE